MKKYIIAILMVLMITGSAGAWQWFPIASSIVDGVTNECPDSNSVFDALAGKQASGSYLTSEVDGSITNELPIAGYGIDISGSPASTVAFDPTEIIGNTTWAAGADATIAWTWNVSTGTDPVITFGNNYVNISTGALQVGGTAVSVAGHTHADADIPNNITIDTATAAGKSTNLVGGNSTTLLGSIPYQSNTDVTTLLAPNTSNSLKVLGMTGTGTNGAVPVWNTTDGSGDCASGAVCLGDHTHSGYGVGDMLLGTSQSVTALKTFDKDMAAMKGTSTGKTTISTANTSGTNYTQILKAETGNICTDASVCSGYQASGSYLTVVASDSDWTAHNSYPATCTNQFIRALGDTNTCASVGIADLASVDFGGFTCNGTTCTVDSDSVHSTFGLIAGQVWTGTHDFGGASVELPNSNTLPGTCTVGQTYIDIDATSTQRLYVCEATNSWVVQKGDTGATGTTGPAPAGQIFLTAAGGWPSTTSGCNSNVLNESTTNKVNYWTLDFNATTVSNAEFTVAMPSDWNAGTITTIFYWSHGATTTNFDVTWGLKCRAFANDSALDQDFGTPKTINDTGGTTGDVYISAATSAITCAGIPAAGQLVQFKVFRDANEALSDVACTGNGVPWTCCSANGVGTCDSMAIDAKLLGVMITFTRS